MSGKRKKGYFKGSHQGKRSRPGFYLEPGLKGFLITCNMREKEAVREAYNIFGEYAEQMYGPEQIHKKEEEGEEDEEEDIEAALKKEVTTIKEAKSSQRRFQVIDSGAKNCVFIKTTVESPKDLVYKILSHVLEMQKCMSRYMMRIHPVAGTCKAEYVKVKELIETVISPYMMTTIVKSFCISIKVRNNSDFGKTQIFPIMRETILEWNPLHTFDDVNPDYVFHMDVIKCVCCLSVMEDFYKLRKYNIQELIKVSEPTKVIKRAVTSTEATDEPNKMETVKVDVDSDEGSMPELLPYDEVPNKTTAEKTPELDPIESESRAADGPDLITKEAKIPESDLETPIIDDTETIVKDTKTDKKSMIDETD